MHPWAMIQAVRLEVGRLMKPIVVVVQDSHYKLDFRGGALMPLNAA